MPLEIGRGLQVKQRLKCLKHDIEFRGYPHLLLKGTKSFACSGCAKDLGDYWHGNPRVYEDHTKYHKTMTRLAILGAAYNVVYVWESDYKHQGIAVSGILATAPLSFLM